MSVVFDLYVGSAAVPGMNIRVTDQGPYGRSVQYGPNPDGRRRCVICNGKLAHSNRYPTCGRCYAAGMAALRQSQDRSHAAEEVNAPPHHEDLAPVPVAPVTNPAA